jgi:hypothetical protein
LTKPARTKAKPATASRKVMSDIGGAVQGAGAAGNAGVVEDAFEIDEAKGEMPGDSSNDS